MILLMSFLGVMIFIPTIIIVSAVFYLIIYFSNDFLIGASNQFAKSPLKIFISGIGILITGILLTGLGSLLILPGIIFGLVLGVLSIFSFLLVGYVLTRDANLSIFVGVVLFSVLFLGQFTELDLLAGIGYIIVQCIGFGAAFYQYRSDPSSEPMSNDSRSTQPNSHTKDTNLTKSLGDEYDSLESNISGEAHSNSGSRRNPGNGADEDTQIYTPEEDTSHSESKTNIYDLDEK